MRRLLLPAFLLTALVGQAPAAAQTVDSAEFKKATTTILCDCGCHPQSVDQCACGRAAEMRREIADLIAQGMSGDDVIEFYVEQHGEKIRIAPTAQGFNLVAWLGPLAAFAAASGLVLLMLRRWSRRRQQEQPMPQAPGPTDQAYQQRLRDALEHFE